MTRSREVGTIKRLLVERRYGFIASDVGTAEFFFHASDLRRPILRFPPNRCTCGHYSYEHEQPTGACLKCGGKCENYVRDLAPDSIYAGFRVTFVVGTDARGPRAYDIGPEETP